MKVKLVFQKSYVERPVFDDCFAVEVDINIPPAWKQAHLIAARSYQPEGSDSNTIGGDINATIITYEDESKIIGKLLTYIEATYSDKEQREAQKSIVKDTVYGIFNDMRKHAVKVIDAHKA